MKDLTLPTLKPCPFCGAGETQMRENGRVWGGKAYGEPSSVSVVHWCVKVDGQPSRVLERVGRDKHSAIEAWNRRAALSSNHEDGRAATSELEQMRERKDAAYLERNQVVAALAKCFPSGVARTAIEGWSEDWHGCVYIDLPTGQASWHFHDSHAYLFDSLPPYTGTWDGHDTPEKYARLAKLGVALGGEKGEAVAGEKLNELLDAYAEIAYQNGVEFCAGNEGDLEGELAAKRAVLALFAAPVGKARMLTDLEITRCWEATFGYLELGIAIQHKFCEKNGIEVLS